MHSRAWYFPYLLALLMGLFALGTPVRAQSSGSADIQAAASEHHLGDIGAPNGGADAEVQKLLDLVRLLRGFAVVILLIALVCAAMFATTGRTQMAISVAVGGLVLFGGFWVFAMIREPLDSTTTITLKEIPPAASFPQAIAPVVQTALHTGLTILTSAIAPFVIIYGFYLAIAFASGKGDPGSVVNYFVGAIIAFAASLIAQFYTVLPLSYRETIPLVNLTYQQPQIYKTAPLSGGNGGLSGTYKNPDGSVMLNPDGTPKLVNPDDSFVPMMGEDGSMTVRSTYYYSGEPNSDPDTDAGRSSTGTPLRYGDANTVGIAAVDPNKIPYGSMITVQTADGPRYFIAADTGGAVKRMTASNGSAPVIDFYSKSQVGDQYSSVTVVPYDGPDYVQLNASQKESFFNIDRFKQQEQSKKEGQVSSP